MRTKHLTDSYVFFYMLFPRPKTISEIAMVHSIRAHKAVNHKYDGHSYTYHLKSAVNVGFDFLYLIPKKDQDNVIAGIWEHDSIEDANLTYNDLIKVTNEIVANIAYACSNEKGKTRDERANAKYYTGIRETEYATFVKLCDRIANVKYSKENKSRMFDVYKKEYQHFKESLYVKKNDRYMPMWIYLEDLLEL